MKSVYNLIAEKNVNALEFRDEKCVQDITTKMSKKTLIWNTELDMWDDMKMTLSDIDCENTRLRAFVIMIIFLWC
jgi:hypothetical protein